MPTTLQQDKASETAPPSEAPHESKVETTAEEEYDEEEDDDYDPTRKADAEQAESDESEGEEPDYSAINTGVSQVRTRGQRYKETGAQSRARIGANGLLEDALLVDVDAVFEALHTQKDDWRLFLSNGAETAETPVALKSELLGLAEEKVQIYTTYTFAGKLVRELKLVDANSAEAKAYLNSTSALMSHDENGPKQSFVTVMRTVPGELEPRQLRIKLKRPSLVDKFLAGDKKNKLTTLEKSRLDWASFVDKKKLKDDLASHNKGGYLEKEAFLGRMEAKRDSQYQQARELDRQRQWQQQQKMA